MSFSNGKIVSEADNADQRDACCLYHEGRVVLKHLEIGCAAVWWKNGDMRTLINYHCYAKRKSDIAGEPLD